MARQRTYETRRGTTLPDLITALAILALGLSLLLPRLRQVRDRTAVRGAREAVVALVAEARARALGGGGATLVVRPSDGTVRVDGGGAPSREVDLAGGFGVRVVDPSSDSAVLRYGALGLGVAASRTVTLARGEQIASLVVSSYGRVVRR